MVVFLLDILCSGIIWGLDGARQDKILEASRVLHKINYYFVSKYIECDIETIYICILL